MGIIKLSSIARDILTEESVSAAKQDAQEALKTILQSVPSTETDRIRDNMMAWKYFTKDGQDYFKAFQHEQPSPEVVKAQIEALTKRAKDQNDYFVLEKALHAMEDRYRERASTRHNADSRNKDAVDQMKRDMHWDEESPEFKYMPDMDNRQGDWDDKAGKFKHVSYSPAYLAKFGLDPNGKPLDQATINKIAADRSKRKNDFIDRMLAQIEKDNDTRRSSSADTEKDYTDTTKSVVDRI